MRSALRGFLPTPVSSSLQAVDFCEQLAMQPRP